MKLDEGKILNVSLMGVKLHKLHMTCARMPIVVALMNVSYGRRSVQKTNPALDVPSSSHMDYGAARAYVLGLGRRHRPVHPLQHGGLIHQ